MCLLSVVSDVVFRTFQYLQRHVLLIVKGNTAGIH